MKKVSFSERSWTIQVLTVDFCDVFTVVALINTIEQPSKAFSLCNEVSDAHFLHWSVCVNES